jgi:hypothetical protein
LLLAGVATVLALGVATLPERTASGPRPLTDLDPDALRSLRIEAEGAPELVFERDASGWRMLAPLSVAADDRKLRQLARMAAAPSHRRFPVDALDLRELRLEPRALRLTLDGQALDIGGTEPVRHRRYVRVGTEVHLIDDAFHHRLSAAPESFVDPRPFPASLEAATLGGAPLPEGALQSLRSARARSVEPVPGAPPANARPLVARPAAGSAPSRFRLAPDGLHLWRERPPLLYLLEAPLAVGLDSGVDGGP